MPIPSCTRRRFLVSASLVVASGAVSAPHLAHSSAAPRLIVSAERANSGSYGRYALVLEGPRVERLRAMTQSLTAISGKIILRLDPVDDHLFDIAAQQAGVSVRRGTVAPDRSGTLAYVAPQRRSLA